jgi:hypothetical protein
MAALLTLTLGGAGALAQPIREHPTVVPLTAEASGAQEDASAHKCCHSSSVTHFEIAMPLLPANLPCGDEHVCCVRPGPANFAEVPSTSGQQRPDGQGEVLPVHSDGTVNFHVRVLPRSSNLLSYGALNTVLRI